MPKFNVGDRVTRLKDVFDQKSELLFGTVTKRYEKDSQFGHYNELYEVLWDNGERKQGYLPHGLDLFKKVKWTPENQEQAEGRIEFRPYRTDLPDSLRLCAVRFLRAENSNWEHGIMFNDGKMLIDMNAQVVNEVWGYDRLPNDFAVVYKAIAMPYANPQHKLEHDRERNRNNRKRWRKAGVCIDCGSEVKINPRTGKPYWRCFEHRVRAANWYSESRWGKRRKGKDN